MRGAMLIGVLVVAMAAPWTLHGLTMFGVLEQLDFSLVPYRHAISGQVLWYQFLPDAGREVRPWEHLHDHAVAEHLGDVLGLHAARAVARIGQAVLEHH